MRASAGWWRKTRRATGSEPLAPLRHSCRRNSALPELFPGHLDERSPEDAAVQSVTLLQLLGDSARLLARSWLYSHDRLVQFRIERLPGRFDRLDAMASQYVIELLMDQQHAVAHCLAAAIALRMLQSALEIVENRQQ